MRVGFQARQADGGLRTGSREDQDRDAAEQEHDRDMLRLSRPAPARIPEQPQAPKARGRFPPLPLDPEIDHEQERDERQKDQ
jgi:hypothetical protein